MTILSDNLKKLADRYGLSLREIGRRADLPPATIQRIIKDVISPRAATVAAIARVFNLDPWELQTKALVTDETGNLVIDTTGASPVDSAVMNATYAKLASSAAQPPRYSHITPEDLVRTASDTDDRRTQSRIVTMDMPSDDLAPVVPRGALLYIRIGASESGLDASCPAVACVRIGKSREDTKIALAFGTLSVSLGEVTLATARGLAMPVEAVIGYVVAWTVFKTQRFPL